MATSSTDLIIPIGTLLWILLSQFTVFFVLLWKGGRTGRISWASIFGLVSAVLSFVFAFTPQPIEWIYDNQTVTYIYSYMIPQGQAVDEYLALTVWEVFLLIVALLKLMLDTDLLGGGGD